MDDKLSVSRLCDFIFSIEKKYGLLDWQIDGIYIWQALRIDIYYKLSSKTGMFTPPAPVKRKNIFQRAFKIFRELYYFVFYNPFLSRKCDNVLLPHPRKIDGKDIYSDELLKKLDNNVLVIDSMGSPIKDYKTFDPYKKFAFILSLLKNSFYRLNSVDSDKIRLIEDDFEASFGFRPGLKQIFIPELIKFRYLHSVYLKYFRKIRAKNLYMVVSYINPYIISAAKEAGVAVTELQHGIITKYHLGYSYPGSESIAYMPDKLLCFGKYWYETTPLPKNTLTEVIGAPFIHALGSKFSANKEKDLILFVSQGVLGRKIFDFAVKTAALLPSCRVNFNLHPSELPGPYMKELSVMKGAPANFTVSYKKPHIFELIGKAEYQAGVFSTTLFEGMALDTKIILLNMPGIEYMRPLIENGDAVLVNTPEEFAEKFRQARAVDDINKYYSENAIIEIN